MTKPDATTLSVLRRAREQRAAMQRRMLPFGLAILAIALVAAARAKPGIGLHGDSLGLLLALGGFAAGILGVRSTLLVRRAPPWAYLPALALLVLSSAALEWIQPTGPGVGGFVIAIVVSMSARIVPVRLGVGLLALAVALSVLAVTGFAGPHHHPGWSSLAVSIAPFAGIFLLALAIWRFRERQEQSARLLRQIEETRDAELRAAALAERQRLARDMHDVLAHSLSGLVLQLEGARLLVSSDPGDARLAGTIDRAHQLARSGLDEARRAIGMLRDDELPGPGLLITLAREFEADTGIGCRFTSSGQRRELRSAVRLALYRVTQEALTNVRKHAHPDRVEVRLEYQQDHVSLAVEDVAALAAGAEAPHAAGAKVLSVPGAAGPAAGGSGGYGLTGMRERAELLGGTLTAGPTAHGFLVLLRVPG